MATVTGTATSHSQPDALVLLGRCLREAVSYGALTGAAYGALLGTLVAGPVGSLIGAVVGMVPGAGLGLASGPVTWMVAVGSRSAPARVRRLLFAGGAVAAVLLVYAVLLVHGEAGRWEPLTVAGVVANPALVAGVVTYRYAPKVLGADVPPSLPRGTWPAVAVVVVLIPLLTLWFGAASRESRHLAGVRDAIVSEAALPEPASTQGPSLGRRCSTTLPVAVTAQWRDGELSAAPARDRVADVLQRRGYVVGPSVPHPRLQSVSGVEPGTDRRVTYTAGPGFARLQVSSPCR